MTNSSFAKGRMRLLSLLRDNSVRHGDFILSSGAHSKFYVDCKLTTLHPEGASLVGKVMYHEISETAKQLNVRVQAIGGLTMGADPIALAIGIHSYQAQPTNAWNVFTVRKTPKTHGQNKLIEGNFSSGDHVVIIDDVVTRGDSTLKAIQAVREAGGHVAFVAVLVDRDEGGRHKIEAIGIPAISVFSRVELFGETASTPSERALATA